MDSACLPSGLDCYNKNEKQSKDNCSAVLPCRGIYADVVKHGVEDVVDLPMKKYVKHALDKYQKYKAGFNYNKGELLFDKLIENNHSFSHRA